MQIPLKSPQRHTRLLALRVTGVTTAHAEVQTVTFPATTSASQGDYIVLENQAGVKSAIWLDIDADGTAPTGALYVAADNQIEVDIATGDSAADVAAKVVAAIGVLMEDVTIVDNEDGTVTFTQDIEGACENPVPKNADDSGAGSITAVVDEAGAASATSLDEGVHDASLAETGEYGQYVLTISKPFARTPVIAPSVLTADRILKIHSVSSSEIQIRCFDATDGTTAKDASFSLMVLGFDSEYQD